MGDDFTDDDYAKGWILKTPAFSLLTADGSELFTVEDRGERYLTIFTDRDLLDTYIDGSDLRWRCHVIEMKTAVELLVFVRARPGTCGGTRSDPAGTGSPARPSTSPPTIPTASSTPAQIESIYIP